MKKLLIILSVLLLPAFADEAPIQNLNEYFQYLPNAVHDSWTPFKSNKDYEVTVQFRVLKNGEITKPMIVNSTNEKANASAINAVKNGAPYKPLPASFTADGVNTQVQLKYIQAQTQN